MSVVAGADVAIGDALPDLAFGPVTRAMLALYAGASGDHNPIHIDADFARAAGLPDVFAHGMLSFGVLARLVTDWAGAGSLREFGARFVSTTAVGDSITCTGVVTEVFEHAGETRARIALAAATVEGRRTLAGEAVAVLAQAPRPQDGLRQKGEKR